MPGTFLGAARWWPIMLASMPGPDESGGLADGAWGRGRRPGGHFHEEHPRFPDRANTASGWPVAVAVPINAKLHGREAAWIIDNAGASQCFTTPGLTEALAGGRDSGAEVICL